jgi:hypothetical protein
VRDFWDETGAGCDQSNAGICVEGMDDPARGNVAAAYDEDSSVFDLPGKHERAASLDGREVC